jgi:hypothetical protein
MKYLIIILLLIVSAVGVAHAQSGGGYNLEWNTTDGGGAMYATGGGYELGGTIGQPDAATWQGSGYTLSGGFWHAGRIPVPAKYRIFLPLVMRNS